jgi:cytochrome P450
MAIISTLAKSLNSAAVLKSFFAFLSTYVVYKSYLYPTFFSPLRHVPGPPNRSKANKYHIPFLGHFLDLVRQQPGKTFNDWIEQYGGIVAYRGLFNSPQIVLGDPKAIQHIFSSHVYDYPKPNNTVRLLSQVIGMGGVLLVEGEVHRKQRKMLNPAFSHKHIKEMVPTMAVPAQMLGKIWEGRVDASENGSVEFDIALDLQSCTLDIIGRAGFGYDFQALTVPDNELGQAYYQLSVSTTHTIHLLRVFVPFYTEIPFKHNRIRKQCARTIERVTTQIIREKRAQILADKEDSEDGKDLMSILIRANEQIGTLDDGRLTDAELKAQVTGAGQMLPYFEFAVYV